MGATENAAQLAGGMYPIPFKVDGWLDGHAMGCSDKAATEGVGGRAATIVLELWNVGQCREGSIAGRRKNAVIGTEAELMQQGRDQLSADGWVRKYFTNGGGLTIGYIWQ